ncbi:hypothetical protein [Xenorhabdus ishibashii]|uniref:Uncharacterized protein n=1 Tax=Xenorhabdus ishibashii TaxID=1034471 RepID=A0A2D0K8E0_9GAMM|nr:hypothetical protein [Xenorhabdus ishibashii]PHM59477.1 hypothetical protein Xish_03595 [Xenorhabdus ishibashii]
MGLGAGLSGNVGAGLDGSSPVKANVSANASASYQHQWTDSNEDSASYGNRTSDDTRVSESFADSKSAQNIRNMSDGDINRIRDSETRSLVYDLRASLNRASENYASYNDSLSKEKTISQQANFTEASVYLRQNRLSTSTRNMSPIKWVWKKQLLFSLMPVHQKQGHKENNLKMNLRMN